MDTFQDLAVSGATAAGVVRPEHARRLCAGHFPGDPLLPGAFLVRLMATVAQALVGDDELETLVRCTFHRRVTPDDEIRVTARRLPGSDVSAEVRVDGRRAARAIFRFGAGA